MQEKVAKLYKALLFEDYSLTVIDCTELVSESIRRHSLSPASASALARALTAGAYFCSWLKEDSLSLEVNGNGLGGRITVTGNCRMELCGTIENPAVALLAKGGDEAVSAVVGTKGSFTVVKSSAVGLPDVGTCELVSGNIQEDIAHYFIQSEQRKTFVRLGEQIEDTCLYAYGLFVQELPYPKEENTKKVQKALERVEGLIPYLENREPLAFLQALGGELVGEQELKYRCRCSSERAERAVLSLSREDALMLLQEKGCIEVHCPMCNTQYTFGKADIDRIFLKGKR